MRLSPDQRSFDAGAPVTVTVTITNVGTAATATGFWVDLYRNPTAPPTVNQMWYDLCGPAPCHGSAWAVDTLLAPGAQITLTTTVTSYAPDSTRWPGWLAAGTTDLYLLVDSWFCPDDGTPCAATGAVREQDETNNRAHLGGLTVTGTNPAMMGDGGASLPPRTTIPVRRP
jgi:hypothetical protein